MSHDRARDRGGATADGPFSSWRERKRDEFRKASQPYTDAQTEIYNREILWLGREEFNRRLTAIVEHQLGKTGPSGFEDWNRELDAEIQRRAHEIANARGL